MTTIYQKMAEPIKFKVHEFLRTFGLDLIRFPPVDFRSDEKEIFRAVRAVARDQP